MRYILVDIDDCLSCARWRSEMTGDWDAFHVASVDDKPNASVVGMINALADDYSIIAVTGRPEKWRNITQAWLMEYDVKIDELLMRPADDYRQAPIVKVDLVRARFGADDDIRSNVAVVIDDNEHILQAFRGLGVTTLQVCAP